MSDNKNEIEFLRRMKKRFFSMARSYSENVPGPLLDGWFQIIENMYAAHHRKYHTLTHIDRLYTLWELDALFKGSMLTLEERRLVELGIWFHDVVYVPADPDNEKVSADLACAFLGALGSFASDQEIIRFAIMETKYQRDEPLSHSRNLEQYSARRGREALVDNVVAILSDLDLASLAASWDVFSEDVANIRKEFSRVSDVAYCWGRVKFMAALLKHPIYLRAKHLEEAARDNLEKHLVDLIQGLSQEP